MILAEHQCANVGYKESNLYWDLYDILKQDKSNRDGKGFNHVPLERWAHLCFKALKAFSKAMAEHWDVETQCLPAYIPREAVTVVDFIECNQVVLLEVKHGVY